METIPASSANATDFFNSLLELEPFQHLQVFCLIARQLRLSLSGSDDIRDPRAALAGVSFHGLLETGLRQFCA